MLNDRGTEFVNLSKYWLAIKTGIIRSAITEPIDHIFEYIRTQQQTSQTNVTQVLSTTIKTKGITGFWSGMTPGYIKGMIKQVYRWPMMIYTPQYYASILPINNKPFVNGLTGISIASIESLIICPFERAKVWMMTTEKTKKSFSNLFNEVIKNNQLYRGLSATYMRQILSWSSFLIVSEESLRIMRTLSDNEYSNLFFASIITGGINTCVVMPIECIKSNMQSTDNRLINSNDSLINVFKKIVNVYGIRGLYVSWQIKLTQYIIHSLFTVYALDKLKQGI